jgi:hypothetical protein
LAILASVTLASLNNALPEDGVTAPKHVGAILMQILIFFIVIHPNVLYII